MTMKYRYAYHSHPITLFSLENTIKWYYVVKILYGELVIMVSTIGLQPVGKSSILLFSTRPLGVIDENVILL